MLLELFERGGWLVGPILACSVLALAIVFERLFFGFRKSRVLPARLANAIDSKNSLTSALDDSAEVRNSAAGRIAHSVLAQSNRDSNPSTKLEEIASAAGKEEAQLLNRYLDTLGTIASVTPLLGLLGTVIGMIKVFEVIEAGGLGNSEQLAGGISEALISTALGLVVAIPSLALHRYLKGRRRGAVHQLEAFSERLIRTLATGDQA